MPSEHASTAAAAAVLAELRSMADPSQLAGMARYGIATGSALGGISVPTLRAMAKRLGKDHAILAWGTLMFRKRRLS